MTWRAAASGATGTSSSVVTIPSGAQVGDIAYVLAADNGGTANSFPAPTGWTAIGTPDVNSNAISSQLFYKILASGEPGSTVTFTGTSTPSPNRMVTAIEVVSGDTTSGSVIPSAVVKTTANTTVTTPTATTAAANSDVIVFVAMRSATSTAGTLTAPTGYTSDANANNGAVTPTLSIAALHQTAAVTSSGTAIGGDTYTANVSVTSNAYIIALAPSAPSSTVGAPISATPVANTGTGTTTSIVVPSGSAAGNLAVLVLEGSDVWTNTAPTGWAKATPQAKSGISLDVWSKSLVSGDLGATITVTSNNTVGYKRELKLHVFPGGQLGDIKTNLESVAGTSHSTPVVTAQSAGASALVGVADRASPGSQSWTLPAGLTLVDQFFGTGGGAVSGVDATQATVGAGSVGPFTITGTVSTAAAAMYAVVIEPTGTTGVGSVSGGADLVLEPRVTTSITATFTSPVTGVTWASAPGSPPLTLSGASTATVSFTTPPDIALKTYTLRVTGTVASGTAPYDDVNVTVYPVTRRFFAVGGGEVPLRVMRFT